MKIQDYEFRIKFRQLIKYCKPDTKYVLNKGGLEKLDNACIKLNLDPFKGRGCSDDYFGLTHYWLQISNNNFVVSNNRVTPISKIDSLHSLTFAFLPLVVIELRSPVGKILLDASNLEQYEDI